MGLCFISFEYIRDALIKSGYMLTIERVAATNILVNCRFPDVPPGIIHSWFIAVILRLTMFAQNIIRLPIISCREFATVAAILFFISFTFNWTWTLLLGCQIFTKFITFFSIFIEVLSRPRTFFTRIASEMISDCLLITAAAR